MNLKSLQSLISIGFLSSSIHLIWGINSTVRASGFAPLYSNINSYETTILSSGDLADIYFPDLSNETNPDSLPIALLLQGYYVDKIHYSQYASTVASYGFVVVVPNNVNIAIETMARWSSVFLRANLLDDEEAIPYLYNTGDL